MRIVRWLAFAICTLLLVISGNSQPVRSQLSEQLQTVVQLQNEATQHQQQGNLNEAIATIQNSLDLLGQPTTTHGQQALANSRNILGDLYFAQSRFQAALDNWEAIQPIYDQTPAWATHRHRNLIKQSHAQQYLGRIPQSCQLLLKSLNVADPLVCDAQGRIENPKSLLEPLELPRLQATESLLELADLWRKSGHFADAALILDALATQQPENPQVILAQANWARSRGDQERGRQESTQGIQFDVKFCPTGQSEFYREAAAAYQRLQTGDGSDLAWRSRVYQITLELLQNHLSEATKLIDLRALQNPSMLVAQYAQPEHLITGLQYAQALNCVDIQRAEQQKTDVVATNYTRAAIRLGEAIEHLAHEHGNPQVESYALGYQGRFYEQSRNFNQALHTTQKALDLSVNFPHLQYQWLWQKGRILRQQGEARDKILPSYRLAYKILEGLRKNLVTFNQDVQYDFRDRVEPLYREYVDLLLTPTEGQNKVIQTDLQTARDVIENLKLTELNNFFQENCAVFPREEIESLAQDTVILYPILLKNRVEILVKYPQDQNLREYHSAIAGKDVESLITQFRNKLARPGQFKAVQSIGAKLYTNLLQEVLQDIEANPALQINTLAFVLDTTLQQIPMAALFDEHEQYLIERYAIAIAPGLQLIKPEARQKNISQVFFAGVSKANRNRAPLPMVEQHQQLIKSVLPKTTVALNENIDEQAFSQVVLEQPMQVFHVATHAVFSSDPEKTFIAVWEGEVKAQDLRRLFLQREARRSPPIDLLVLAACETATNDKRATLGLAGLATQSGARSTVATLWLIEANAQPGEFSRSLYQYLQDPQLTKAQAFQKAQLELLHRNPTKTKQWAPYVLVGNWS